MSTRLPWHQEPCTRSPESFAAVLRTTRMKVEVAFRPEAIKCDCGCGRDVAQVASLATGSASGLSPEELAKLLVALEFGVIETIKTVLDSLTDTQRQKTAEIMLFLRSCEVTEEDGSYSRVVTGETAAREHKQAEQGRGGA